MPNIINYNKICPKCKGEPGFIYKTFVIFKFKFKIPTGIKKCNKCKGKGFLVPKKVVYYSYKAKSLINS